jgi:WhiB family redox-sensing transcriptional regulator
MKTLLKTPLEESREWWPSAACRGIDSSLFFSPEGEHGTLRRAREQHACAVCRRCPVLNQCAAYALSTRQMYGTWGGLTEAERQDRLREGDGPPHPPASTSGVTTRDG